MNLLDPNKVVTNKVATNKIAPNGADAAAYIAGAILALALVVLGIPAVVWLILSAVIPAYTFGYWQTVALYLAWRLVRGPIRAPKKKTEAGE